jgi:hypothetical protein
MIFVGWVSVVARRVVCRGLGVQALGGDFVHAERSGTGGVACSEGQAGEEWSSLVIEATLEDYAPRSVGPRDAGLDAAGELGSVAAFGLAGEQLFDGLPAAFDFGALAFAGLASGGGAVLEILREGGVELDAEACAGGVFGGQGSALAVGWLHERSVLGHELVELCGCHAATAKRWHDRRIGVRDKGELAVGALLLHDVGADDVAGQDHMGFGCHARHPSAAASVKRMTWSSGPRFGCSYTFYVTAHRLGDVSEGGGRR